MAHDLVARPRRRTYRHFSDCRWHYAEFAAGPGQALYRWRVKELFDRLQIDLRLPDTGEDSGRLVHVIDDDRDELIDQVLGDPTTSRHTREHAVALFRARGAGREAKRSAVEALYGLLEERRSLLKAELMTKDEDALFQIANQFAVRHRDARQRGNYDEAFLDWTFWWYLGTLDLTDQLLARPRTP